MVEKRSDFHIGDRVVFSQDVVGHGSEFDVPGSFSLVSAHGAAATEPAFGIIERVRGDGWLLARTADGGRELVRESDPMLRHAAWWERLVYRAQFRGAEAGASPSGAAGY